MPWTRDATCSPNAGPTGVIRQAGPRLLPGYATSPVRTARSLLKVAIPQYQSFGTGTSLTGVTVAVQRVNPGQRNLWIAFTSVASTM